MTSANLSRLALALLITIAGAGIAAQQPQAPVFRSGVDVTAIDVTVVTNDGTPIDDLKPADFRVRVDGRDRRVLRSEWIPLVAPAGTPLPKAPEGYTSNDLGSASGRLILIAIDQPNTRPDGFMKLRPAVEAFIDQIKPSDPVAAVGLGTGGLSTPFTTDREVVKKALSRMSGEADRGRIEPLSQLKYWHDMSVGLADAIEIYKGSMSSVEGVLVRECKMWKDDFADAARLGLVTTVPDNPPPEPIPLTTDYDLGNCRNRINDNARQIASVALEARQRTLMAIRGVLRSLRAIDAPKTMVLVSEGFSLMDDPQSVDDLTALSAAARTNIYVLKLDDQAFDASQSKAATFGIGDRTDKLGGLGLVADAGRGEVFNVMGNGSAAIRQLTRELSGYYMIGLEAAASDTDGKSHPINVQVSRRGAVVRARRAIMVSPASAATPVNALEAVADALRTPLSMPALQIRVGTFALRDPKEQRVQLLIHADVGADYQSGREVTLGYVIADSKGKIVVNKLGTGRLPVAAGPPSPLSFSETAVVDPGDYTLKFAIADGDRVGSVEHVVRASLIDAGAYKLSELMVGGPLDGRSVLAPTVGHDIRFGTVQGYIEAYGPNAGVLTMRYEIAPGLEAPSIVTADVPGRPEGDDRAVFSYSMSVADLKPGEYFLRASLSSGGSVARRVVRAFRVAPAPPPASTSVGAAATKSVALDVRPEYLAPRFRRETLSRRDTLQRFRGTLPAGATAAFDEGTTALVLGDDAKAEAAFRKSLETGLAGADSTAPLAYLGLTYAAAGKDLEAVGIWQAALVDGAGFSQLYEWMADALLRLGDLDAARSLLAEAVNKWPAETGFAKTLAFVFAKDGRAREAVALLERYIADHPEDLPAMYSGVQWMYQVHQAGMAVRSKPDDVKLASAWTDAYTLASGPDSDTVKRWMLAIEK